MARKRLNQTPVLLVYVITMLLCLVLFGSAALIMLEMFVNQPKLDREQGSNSGASTVDGGLKEADFSAARETILFVGESGGNINGMALVRVLPDALSVRIVPVSPYTYTSAGGIEGTVQHLYSTGGTSYLTRAVENAFGVTCDKYIIISNDGWKSFVDHLGGTSAYSFPQELYYKNEATGEITSFSQGAASRTLYGDDIRRIITYPLYDNGNATRVQVVGELSAALINSACTYNSGSIVSNIQSIFNTVYNNSETDITSRSFSRVRDAYEYLIGNSASPATYRVPAGTWNESGYFSVGEDFKSDIQTYFELAEETSTTE